MKRNIPTDLITFGKNFNLLPVASIIETLEQASIDAGIRSFVYADFETENEFQAVIDKFKFEEYPLLLIPPFTSAGAWTNAHRKGTLQIRGWVLVRLKENTVNYRSKALEISTIQPMKNLAMKFIKKMIVSDVIDPLAGSIQDTVRGSYQFSNKHLFGAAFTVNLPIIETVC